MLFSSIFVVLASTSMVSSLPLKRQDASGSNSTSADLLVLKFANVLEQLETQFYTQALSTFQESDFVSAGFTSAQVAIQQFQAILNDESTHTSSLEDLIVSLGDEAISDCTFDFSSVLTDVSTMVTTARLIENVGVGAYLGAAQLISDTALLSTAATIVTIEARHQTMLNILNAGNAIPQAFDIALLPQEVLAIAGGFISGCDTGIQALPSLTVTNTGSVQEGTLLTFSSDAITSDIDPSTLSCQMLAGGLPFSISLNYSSCIVPPGLSGPVAIFVTNDSQPLINNPVDQFLGDIVAGPTMAFIDNQPDAIDQLVRVMPGSGPGPAYTVTTATLSPDAASSVIASYATATASVSVSADSSSDGTSDDESNTEDDSTSDDELPGGPNMATGPTDNGAITVLGWSNVPS